ncbi:long-chain fatty acid--CoA ligase [Sneathiella sp. CAU 1612]|uniref:Long-chain-fatty-acid--CoA ligase n=1 Tax=Sneathiella sedimenti TaxID=2816034 RepID=A0ABS3F1B7_9PROT|nr:long-chain fatty acid--CoA ligase [Sneathiella sedimenti]MBO0332294.1 long-chain fatty acid--CoA ligase [Sneathiella sedimenti]
MSEFLWEKSYPKGVTWEIEIEEKPVYALLDDTVAKWPNNFAIDFMDKRITYAELDDLVNRAAKGFRALGVKEGVHVGLYLPNTPHYIVCFFGILKAGGTVVNYSPLDAKRELRHKIEDSHTDFIVTLDLEVLYPNIAEMLKETRLKKIIVGCLKEVLPFPKNFLYPIVKSKEISKIPNDDAHLTFKQLLANDGKIEASPVANPAEQVAVLQYTGGTTGLPKGAMLTHKNLIAACQQFRRMQEGEDGVLVDGVEKVLAVLPLFHIYALSVIMNFGIAGGYEIILHPKFELNDVMKDLNRKKPSVFPGVPTMYMAIASHPDIKDYDLSSLKFCASGGAPLPLEVQEKFQKVTGCRLLEGWGMTETSPSGTSTPMTDKRVSGAAGVPLPGIEIRILGVDDKSVIMPTGEIGEISIKGPNVMKGYWNKPEATEASFVDGFFLTGDTGYLDEDGYMHIVDRTKDMITSGGFNVYPRIIEEAIFEHPAVAEVTVVGIPDDYRGEAAKAFIKLTPNGEEFTLEELREFLQDKLGKHELPAAVEFRPELPKTLVGKLSKKELVEEEKLKYEARKKAEASA